MQNEGSFDLNRSIQHWRENLAQSPAFRSENLYELETHLRDSIAMLQTRGLSAEEAFIVAVRRVGKDSALEQEFGKVNGAAVWFDRCLWILLAVQAWTLISSGATLAWSVASPLGMALNDILPGFGLEKFAEDPLRLAFAIVFSPLPVAIGAGLVWWYFVRSKQRTTVLVQSFLRRPRTLALTIFLLCMVIQFTAVWALQTWCLPVVYHTHVSAMGFKRLLMNLPEYMILAGLTFIVARKRLRAGIA
jgi:hypothetical protein